MNFMVMVTPLNNGGYNVIFFCIRSKYCLNGTYLRNISNRVRYVIGILIGVRVRDRASLNPNPTTKKTPHKKMLKIKKSKIFSVSKNWKKKLRKIQKKKTRFFLKEKIRKNEIE